MSGCTKDTPHCIEANCGVLTPSCCKQFLVDLVVHFAEAAKRAGLTFFLDYGTLLGCLRNGQFIPWDSDADLSIFKADRSKLQAVGAMLHEQYGYQLEDNMRDGLFRLFVSKQNRLHVDISLRFLENGRYRDAYDPTKFGIPTEWLLPLQTATWEGHSMPVPACAQQYIEQCYGKDCVQNIVVEVATGKLKGHSYTVCKAADYAAAYVCIFTPFFDCGLPARQEELFECLKRNCQCNFVHRIFLLLEDPDQDDERFKHPKVTVIRPVVKKRQTFRDMLMLMNTMCDPLPKQLRLPKRIFILCNTDIYFDDSLQRLVNYRSLGKDCFALSRYDVDTQDNVVLKNDPESQDAWVFEMPFLEGVLHTGDYYLGRLGCDNRFAYELNATGYKVSNPSHTIRACHLHNVNLRTWSRATDVKPPYMAVPLCHLDATS